MEILPGTLARDVIKKLGLDGMVLSRPEGGYFAMADNVYDAVAGGQKVFAIKDKLQAGLGWS